MGDGGDGNDEREGDGDERGNGGNDEREGDVVAGDDEYGGADGGGDSDDDCGVGNDERGCCYLCHCTENKEAVQYKLGNEKRGEEREPGRQQPSPAPAGDYEYSILMEFCWNSGDKRNVLIRAECLPPTLGLKVI